LQSASSRNAGCTPTGVVMRCEPEARNSTAVAREIRALCYPFFFWYGGNGATMFSDQAGRRRSHKGPSILPSRNAQSPTQLDQNKGGYLRCDCRTSAHCEPATARLESWSDRRTKDKEEKCVCGWDFQRRARYFWISARTDRLTPSGFHLGIIPLLPVRRCLPK
jgi:hypothetical protein